MSRSGAEVRASESKSKFIQDRINTVEKDFGQLCDTLSSYTRKTARLRDKGDLLAKELLAHVEKETLNPSTKKGVSEFASVLAAIQDYRQAQVNRLEAKVVAPVASYGIICRKAKAELKSTFTAQQREQKAKQQLEKVTEKSSNRQQIAKATLQTASLDASKTSKLLENEIDKFEKQKLTDLKKVLSDFVNIEIHFHAKALELYTDCFKGLANISEDEDISEFRNYLHPPKSASRLGLARTASQQSLNSSVQSDFYNQTPPSSARRLPQPSTPSKQQQQQQQHQNGLEDDDNDEDDDSEEYSDEYETDDDISETPRHAPSNTHHSPSPRVVQVKR